MQIVIDIPEEDFERCKKRFQMRICIMGDAIASGVPLPKGHGRLIDADELYNSLKFPTQQFALSFKQVLDDAPTIIEADKAERSG